MENGFIPDYSFERTKTRQSNSMKYLLLNLLFFLLWTFPSSAQLKELKLEEAVSLGLKNNFSILISANDREIAKNNNTPGNAGFLPRLEADGVVSKSFYSNEVKDTSGVSKTSQAYSGTVNMGLSFNWTLFDGFGMFIRKEKLSALLKQGETSMRATIENVLSEIIVSYYAIVQNTNRLKVLQDAINFSLRRKELTMKKYQIGLASELAYLQSITDLNADSAAFLRQQSALKNAKADLNLLMVISPQIDFEVLDTILFKRVLNYDDLVKRLSSDNTQIEIAKRNVEISKMNYRLTHSPKYPQINFFTDYNFIGNKYDYGQTRQSSNYGPVVGLNFSYSLFDGFNRQRNSANAQIQSKTNALQLEQTSKEIETSLYQLYNDYRNNLKLISFEREDLKITQRNTYVAFEKYRLGELSDIDLRQIQLNQLQAENSLLLAQFEAKQLETELLRISGLLFKEQDRGR
jgi:outer membrane protein TolC